MSPEAEPLPGPDAPRTETPPSAPPGPGVSTLTHRLSPRPHVTGFISRFRDNFVPVELIRVGGDGDGGYLMPDILDRIDVCFSPGVSDVANFEQALSQRYGIQSYMADASVAAPPFADPNFNFRPLYLGSRTERNSITLSDWMKQSIGDSNARCLLQMDIEGAEYDVFTLESGETLRRFSVMVVEFHGLQFLFEIMFMRSIRAIFNKILEDFCICHAHPNNCCGAVTMDGITVPRILEVTFLRRDLLPSVAPAKAVSLPHPLDRVNVPGRPDLVLPPAWWKRPTAT